MGCQHSSPVPTASDFYHLPSTDRLAPMDDRVARIENPGMCYNLNMRTHRELEGRQSLRDSIISTLRMSKKSAPHNDRLSQVSDSTASLSTQSSVITDKHAGLDLNGLHLNGPDDFGRLILKNRRQKIVAMMTPKRHLEYDFFYEITSPKSPIKEDDSSVTDSLGSSISSIGSNIELHTSQGPPRHFEDYHTDLHRHRSSPATWYTWATVHKVPHSLEYQLTLVYDYGEVKKFSRNSHEDFLYSLHYCGSVLGPCKMRIDKSENRPVALISENLPARPSKNTTRISLETAAREELTEHDMEDEDSYSFHAAPTPLTEETSNWDLVIGPGVDPCLMICFTAIVNRSQERRSRSR